MLDGGRMLFVVIEILRGGRRIAPEKEALVHFAGFALMMAGVLVVTYLDIARLVT
jgi:regulator of sigma E protease